jgi:murein DD-endopeptidase MepM/ murein hydrolase activator NlpD
VRRIIALTLVMAAIPAAAPAFVREGTLTPAATPFAFPIDGAWEWGGPDTHFGDRGGAHDGEDLMADCGTPVVAAAAGRVVFTDSDGAAGNYLVVRGASGDAVYMHLRSKPRLRKGDTVDAGQSLGAVGRTGNASACHLHFELWTKPGWYDGGKARDPRADLVRWSS